MSERVDWGKLVAVLLIANFIALPLLVGLVLVLLAVFGGAAP